tara:strand:+ start:1107 stop:1289 length:183 start_codon:yes stop_codon:yes gene_type:complete
MKLINDKGNPELVAILDSAEEFNIIQTQVDRLNSDLVDSGYERYQYKAEQQGLHAYIKRT